MQTESLTQQFIEALLQFEESGDVERLGSIFSSTTNATRNGQQSQTTDNSDPIDFWRTYRDQFSSIKSTFSSVRTAGALAILEWSSDGILADAKTPIHYRGVSILEFESSRITQFATYYDAAAFTGTH